MDVVLDTLGGDTQNRSWKALKKGGILVSIVAPPSPDEAAKNGVRSAFFSAHPSSSQLAEIAKLVDAGTLKPVVETVLPPSDARRPRRPACRRLRRARTRPRRGPLPYLC